MMSTLFQLLFACGDIATQPNGEQKPIQNQQKESDNTDTCNMNNKSDIDINMNNNDSNKNNPEHYTDKSDTHNKNDIDKNPEDKTTKSIKSITNYVNDKHNININTQENKLHKRSTHSKAYF